MKQIHLLVRWLKNHYAKDIAIDLILVVAVYLLGQVTVSGVIWAGGVKTLEELYRRPALLTAAYVIGGLISLVGVVGVLRLRKTSLKDIALKKPKLTDIAYGILGFGAYFLVVRIVLILVGIAFPAFNINQEQNIGLSGLASSLMPAAFVALAVLPPFTEELLFRGFLLTRLQKHKVKLIYAALIVSAIFGAMHGQWNVSIDTFVLSCVMIYSMQQRKSLWVTITMHVLKNSIAFYALFILKIHS